MIAALAVAALLAGFAAEPCRALETGGPEQTPAAAGDSSSEKSRAAADSFKQDFPSVNFSRVLESGIEGLYEVISGTNIVYYAPAAHKVIAGDLFDAGGLNVTAEKRETLRALQEAETAKLIDILPLDKAIKIGHGRNVVVEFTDIDCPYCRKVEEFFKNRNDITRYVFLLPLDQIHPRSAAKSREVLCAKDPAMAYATAMDGGFDKAALKGCGSRDKDIEKVLSQYKAVAGTMGVEGTPIMWVNKKQVTGADTKKIEDFLASKTTGTAASSGS
ncbi:MAG TPA: DsbC family protein [Nitrospirota bacterium]|nr:DsbC family protein [Nitrospirota bacterium]